MADNFLSELANPTRIEILNLLRKNPMAQSQIAQKLNSTIQGISRHIDRLNNSSLIEKTVEGKLQITPIGEISLIQTRTFFFLFRHRKYFVTHSFDGIPDRLVRRIGELENSEFLENPMESWQRSKEMAHSTKEYYFGTATTAPLEIIPLFSEFAKKGIKLKLIFAKNSIVPKGFNKQKEKQWEKYIDKNIIEEKYIKQLPIVVCVNEKMGEMVFSNKKMGGIDAKEMFIGSDTNTRRWCLDLFDYYWNETDSLKPFSIKER